MLHLATLTLAQVSAAVQHLCFFVYLTMSRTVSSAHSSQVLVEPINGRLESTLLASLDFRVALREIISLGLPTLS